MSHCQYIQGIIIIQICHTDLLEMIRKKFLFLYVAHNTNHSAVIFQVILSSDVLTYIITTTSLR